MDREQAIAVVGEANIEAVEAKNCEPTNRVGYNGACQGDDLTEWCAAVRCGDVDGNDCCLAAYYYTNNRDDQIMAEHGDGSCIDWAIDRYEIM